jgi:methylated-DNA-[protein]-cysteine S-methyltransferase
VFRYEYELGEPIGRVGIEETDGMITGVSFLRGGSCQPNAQPRETPLIKSAAAQLIEYLRRARRSFDLPLAPRGTPFQLAVWRELQAIPYGQTRSYGEIAAQLDAPRAFRAVGMACNRNPIAIIIPFHRVVGHDGALVGYAAGVDTKRALIEFERTPINF